MHLSQRLYHHHYRRGPAPPSPPPLPSPRSVLATGSSHQVSPRLQLGVSRKWGDSFSPLPDPYDLCLKLEDTLVSARLENFRPWVSKFLSRLLISLLG